MRTLFAAGALALALLGPVPASAQNFGQLPDFTRLYEEQGAAVVSIQTTQRVRHGNVPGLSEDDPMSEFFRRFGPRGRGPDREFEIPGAGSGFIVSADGYVITNAHVVDGADEVNVRLTDKREFKAKVVGTDKRTDVAVIKIEATGLPRATVGDPSKLKVGEWVVAIGQPFGLDNTLTAGVVSAKGRSLPQEDLVPFIQTDVAINPGNSGGPLFNLRGEVVGINSLIYSRSGGYQGIAFAIPIDIAMDVVKQLQTTGRVSRGRIGVVIQEVTKEMAEAFGMPRPQGALVNDVVKGGPADKGGIQAGDIILRFDGKTVNQSQDLPRIVTQVRPGSKAPVQVWRKGATQDLTVTVEEWKEEPATRRTGSRGDSERANRLGIVVSELPADQRRELKVEGGVVVEKIVGTVRGNLQEGDVILEVRTKGQATPIRSVKQFNDLLASLEKNASVTLLVRRGDNQLFTTVRLANGG